MTLASAVFLPYKLGEWRIATSTATKIPKAVPVTTSFSVCLLVVSLAQAKTGSKKNPNK